VYLCDILNANKSRLAKRLKTLSLEENKEITDISITKLLEVIREKCSNFVGLNLNGTNISDKICYEFYQFYAKAPNHSLSVISLTGTAISETGINRLKMISQLCGPNNPLHIDLTTKNHTVLGKWSSE